MIFRRIQRFSVGHGWVAGGSQGPVALARGDAETKTPAGTSPPAISRPGSFMTPFAPLTLRLRQELKSVAGCIKFTECAAPAEKKRIRRIRSHETLEKHAKTHILAGYAHRPDTLSWEPDTLRSFAG